MHHEHTVSKMYTPVGLGEIMANRSFTPTGEPNPSLKPQQTTQDLTVAGDRLTREARKVWQPRSMLAILDALNSIRWAWILLDFGPELVIHEFCDWLRTRARLHPQRLDQFKSYYDQISWQLATLMRSNLTFAEATGAIREDTETYQKAMAPEISAAPTAPTKRRCEGETHDESRARRQPKGSGRGKSAGTPPHWTRTPLGKLQAQPGVQPPWTHSTQ